MTEMAESLARQIEAIHAAPFQVVIEFAGAGSQALAWLHEIGGSSQTILEATDRYASAALAGLIGFWPEQFASVQVARVMATQAYIRACELATPGQAVAGVGCTATIATARTKRGNHRCCIAVCDSQGVRSYNLTIQKGQRTRQEEEAVVSLLLIRAIARSCGLAELPEPALLEAEAIIEQWDGADLLERLLLGEFNWLLVTPEGFRRPGRVLPGLALLSGAFNPLHEGHRQLAKVAAGRLNREVYFELPLVNAEKAAIKPDEAHRRLAQFAGLAPVLITTAPLFNQKAQFFPHSVFIVGVDTVKRLVEPRFYGDDPARMRAAFQELREAGCRFLVAGRRQGDKFLTLAEVDLPEGYRELFESVPETQIRADISSTAIRAGFHSG